MSHNIHYPSIFSAKNEQLRYKNSKYVDIIIVGYALKLSSEFIFYLKRSHKFQKDIDMLTYITIYLNFMLIIVNHVYLFRIKQDNVPVKSKVTIPFFLG